MERSDQGLSETELELVRQIEKLVGDGAALGRDRDQVLGLVINNLITVEPEKNLQLSNYPSRPIATVEFSYLRFDGDSILEAGLKALKHYLEKKERV